MIYRWSICVCLLLIANAAGCLRNHTKPGLKPDPTYDRAGLPKPQIVSGGTFDEKPSPVSLAREVRPPVVEEKSIPAMPGMPVSQPKSAVTIDPVAPIQPVSLESAPDAGKEDEKKTGPIRKLIEDIRERREQRREEREKKNEEKNQDDKKKDDEKDRKDLPKPMPPGPPLSVADMPRIDPPMPPKSTVSARQLVQDAVKKFDSTPDYECKLTKREVVNGKAQPTEEMLMQFRKEPYSVYMHVTGENGKGREILYVKGQNQGKMTVITGKGDNPLLGTGKKMEFPIDSPLVCNRNRHRIDSAGLMRTLSALQKYVEDDATGHRPSGTIRLTQGVEKKEYSSPMIELDIAILVGDDPLLPKGGRRKYYFDMDPKSSSYGLPVMIQTFEHEKEVEYYVFSDFRMPAKLTDADFSPQRLGKK